MWGLRPGAESSGVRVNLSTGHLVPCICPSTSAIHVAQAVTLHTAICMSQWKYDELRTSSLAPIADLHQT